MDKVGFIGLGRMGRGMASNLCGKGFELVVYDINPKPMLALEKLGARRANGVAGVAQAADVIITMLPASPEVEHTVCSVRTVFSLTDDLRRSWWI